MISVDITGHRFGKLVAVAFAHSVQQGKQKRQFWLFRCDCGNEREMQKASVTGGAAVSCGCHRLANFDKVRRDRMQATKQATIPPSKPISLGLEQLANRATVPPSMKSLPSRVVLARHT